MAANHPLHLSLTKSQMEWLTKRSEDTNKSKSKFVQELIEASQKNELLLQKVDLLTQKTSDLDGNLRSAMTHISPQLEIILAYVTEIFRESSANLFRINAMVDEFEEPEKVRREVNEFVRKQESAMRSKSIQIKEEFL